MLYEVITIINCNAIFGGIDILLPSNVKVKLDVVPILGGVDNKYLSSSDIDRNNFV